LKSKVRAKVAKSETDEIKVGKSEVKAKVVKFQIKPEVTEINDEILEEPIESDNEADSNDFDTFEDFEPEFANFKKQLHAQVHDFLDQLEVKHLWDGSYISKIIL
jgi:hypothetical protein